ncbi:hypothetical protein [Agrobacterium sp. MCAB5]
MKMNRSSLPDERFLDVISTGLARYRYTVLDQYEPVARPTRING